jgi:phosphate transport system substrate-binding protein
MKKNLILTGILLGAAGIASLFAGGTKEAAPAQSGASQSYTIEVSGSTSVTPLMEMLAADYAKSNPSITVNINGTGSSDGIKAANEGTSEVGMSSRTLSPAEKGYGLTERIIAIDGIAVILNNNNPVSNLTIQQIRDIYTGNVTDWSQAGGTAGKIAVVSREPGSGTRGAFEEIVGFIDRMVLGATEFDGTGAIKAEVSKNVDAIGYISLGSVDSSIKTAVVEGTSATTANVVNGTYKIARPFIILYRADKINSATKQFFDWIMGPQGQAIVSTSWISVK